jgi:hypothetical protein
VAQDDWRVTVTLPAEEQSGKLVASLAETAVEDDARAALGDRVVVGGGDDPGVVFLYTGSPEAEHERLDQDEAAESEELGESLWEVRIELDSHRDAVGMADRIESEADDLLSGYTVSVVRHWRYLLIGADDEDQANEIAEAIRDELPAGAELKVEPSGALVWQAVKPSPFAVLGGLGT